MASRLYIGLEMPLTSCKRKSLTFCSNHLHTRQNLRVFHASSLLHCRTFPAQREPAQ